MNELQERLATNWENARKRRCRIGRVTPKVLYLMRPTPTVPKYVKRERLVDLPEWREVQQAHDSMMRSVWPFMGDIVPAAAVIAVVIVVFLFAAFYLPG